MYVKAASVLFIIIYDKTTISRAPSHPTRRIDLTMIGLILFWFMVILYTVWLYRQHAAKSENEPPALPGALPLIGNAHQMIGDSLCKYYGDEYKSYRIEGFYEVDIQIENIILYIKVNEY